MAYDSQLSDDTVHSFTLQTPPPLPGGAFQGDEGAFQGDRGAFQGKGGAFQGDGDKLALYPRHQCVDQSPESIKAIEDRNVFFQYVLNSRNIMHLRGLPTIHHQAPTPREKPDDLALRNGSTQYYLYGHYDVSGDDPNNDRYFNPELVKGRTRLSKSHVGIQSWLLIRYLIVLATCSIVSLHVRLTAGILTGKNMCVPQ